jgi:hypothetical protein
LPQAAGLFVAHFRAYGQWVPPFRYNGGTMTNADEQMPPDEWFALSEAERAAALRRELNNYEEAAGSLEHIADEAEAVNMNTQPGDGRTETPPVTIVPITFERAYRIAESLDPEDRLKLAAIIWKSLPTKERSRLVSFQFESAASYQPLSPSVADLPPPTFAPPWPILYKTLFDPSTTSELYSAPRRFDLATIFVVTAAYSLLFGIMTALGASPVLKIMFGGLVTIVAVAQALFLKVANPRGVSIVAGAVAHTAISLLIWFAEPIWFLNSRLLSFFLLVAANGIIGGSVMGYLAGVMVGGVFLVAAKLRTKFGRPPDDIEPTISSDVPR